MASKARGKTKEFNVPKRPPEYWPIYDPTYSEKVKEERRKFGRPKRYAADFAGSYGRAIHYGQAS